MSLSEEPQVKIKFTTAQEICDDIWAGAIRFTKEAGLGTDPLFATTIWTGLLLTVKKELDAHNLLRDVQQRFIASFSEIYGIGLDDVEFLANVKAFMQQIWTVITRELGDLDSETKTKVFLSIAEGINEKSPESVRFSSPESYRIFQQVRNLLSSHVYNILHGVDNEMLLQFPDPHRYASQPAQRNPAPVVPPVEIKKPSPAVAPPANTQSNVSHGDTRLQKKIPLYKTFLRVEVVPVVLLALFLAVVTWYNTDSKRPPKANTTPPAISETQAPQLTELSRPASGTILRGKKYTFSELTVNASSSSDCVVTLKDRKDLTCLSFYVRAGDSVTIGVPGKELYIYFASGTHWYGYGKGKMFGEYTAYTKDDKSCDFSQYTFEYTLYPVTDGNFSESPSDENEFF